MTDEYDGTDEVVNSTFAHLGGNIAQGDPLTYCPSVWSYVIDRFGVQSVMDLGSGAGHVLLGFSRKVLDNSVEGLFDNVHKSLYPAAAHDLTTGPARSVVDLVHCQRLLHVDAQYLDNVLKSLLAGNYSDDARIP
jgi:hypothetical protein